MTLINEFIEDYKRNVGRYEKLAQICAHQCESGLKRRGLRALVTFRAKRLDSLTDKVLTRSQEKSYHSIEEIYEDIVDLAGVRIALYFPGDRDEVDSFIRSNFHVDQVKDFPEGTNRHLPYQKRFSGYAARHYRLRLKPENLSLTDQHLTEYVIEVQVGSVLMHAWAEVEHDLVYKSTVGILSQDEYAILDELNGLMHAGEIALERLQRAVKRRINTELQPFSNHYELSSFLYDYIRAVSPRQPSEPFIGRTDVLFEFLQRTKLNSVPALNPILEKCDVTSANQPIAQQIVDQILRANPDHYKAYNEARLAVGRTDPFGAPHETLSYFSDKRNLGWFMRQWIATEHVIGELLANVIPENMAKTNLEPEFVQRLEKVRDLRNDILYGDRWPSEQEMLSAGTFLQKLAGHLRQENERIYADRIYPKKPEEDQEQLPQKEA